MSESPAASGPPRIQRRAGLLALACVAVLLGGGAALALRGRIAASGELILQVHLVAGLLLLPSLLVFVGSHLRTQLGHPNARARGFGFLVALFAIAGCLSGISAWLAPVTRDSGWLVKAHILAFALAGALYWVHRLAAKTRPAGGWEKTLAPFAVAAAFGLWLQPTTPPAATPEPADTVTKAFVAGLSEARSDSGHQMTLEELHDPLYCASCHPEIHERWSASAHRSSSLTDPYYQATLALMQAERPPRDATFCGGCHDPALLFSGALREPVSPQTPGAHFGISCLSCHAVTEMPRRVGNASYTLSAGSHRRDYAVDDAGQREASARSIRSAPTAHRQALSPAFLHRSQFCVGCHKASLTPELNQHRWLRGQNEFDAWEQSGAGGASARTFYPPGPKRRCQDCHMPAIEARDPAAREGKVSDHAFLGSNTALPAHLGEADWLRRNQEFMQDVVGLDLGAVGLTRGESTSRVFAPHQTLSVQAGDELRLDFVVRNQGVGHLFPAGISDLREVWLEVEVLDGEGRALLASGYLDDQARVDPDALRWGTVLLDEEGKPLLRHEVERAHAVLDSRRIMLGASDVARIELTLPAGAARLRARLLDRKFSADYQRFALGDSASPPPATSLARYQIELVADTAPHTLAATDGPRLRDLGIAHLLRGDTSSSREAARAAAQLMPEDPGPHLDLARAALTDGDLDQAEAHLRHADSLRPGHPTGAWLLARVRAARGQHAEALSALAVALEAFPEDRELLLLRSEYLMRLERFAEARTVLEAALVLDPESVSGHALMRELALELGDEEARVRHQAMWDRLRPHSADQALTQSARERDPALDRRANRQFVLRLEAPPTGWAPVVVSAAK